MKGIAVPAYIYDRHFSKLYFFELVEPANPLKKIIVSQTWDHSIYLSIMFITQGLTKSESVEQLLFFITWDHSTYFSIKFVIQNSVELPKKGEIL